MSKEFLRSLASCLPVFEKALCKNIADKEFFFPRVPKMGRARKRNKAWLEFVQHQEDIRQFCARCPEQRACLDYAIEFNEQGYWGGMSASERERFSGKSEQRAARALLRNENAKRIARYHANDHSWEAISQATGMTIAAAERAWHRLKRSAQGGSHEKSA